MGENRKENRKWEAPIPKHMSTHFLEKKKTLVLKY